MKISVITVCYNARDFIEETILSVINQTYNNIEYIIIDGNSTDGTKQIIEKYRDRINIFVSEPDKGLYDAMNKGIGYVTGDYINFMNAGDTFNNLKTIEEIFNNNKPLSDVIYGHSIKIGKNQNETIIYSTSDLKQLNYKPIYRHGASFVKTSVHKKYPFEITKKEFKHALDFNCIYNLYHNGCSFKQLDCIVLKYIDEGISNKPYENKILNYKITTQYTKFRFFRLIKLFKELTTMTLLNILKPFYSYGKIQKKNNN